MINMAIILSSTTKIMELIKKYPKIMDELITLSSKIKKLNNPILQKTIGKKASLLDVAKIAKLSVNTLFENISKSLKDIYNEEVTIDKSSKDEGDWTLELEKRQEQLKKIVLALHEGEDKNNLQDEFAKVVQDVSPTEIAEMEQSLINNGSITAEQITAMCDLHVGIFRESLDGQSKPETIFGHPINTYMIENKTAQNIVNELKENLANKDKLKELKEIITHYTRLENQLFPILEKYGVEGPSAVMWAIHDEVRNEIKIAEGPSLKELLTKIEDMIYKEEQILFPMALETLSESDWGIVRKGEEEIGYSWLDPTTIKDWKPITPADIHGESEIKLNISGINSQQALINMETGKLTLEQLNAFLCVMPVDISFIDDKEEVAYYSNNAERIFPRSPGVIGRKVKNCHPPKSVHKVQEILDSFRDGSKDKASFWIQMGGKFLLIQYFAVRNKDGKFLGTLEVSQDVTEIRTLEGQRRVVDW